MGTIIGNKVLQKLEETKSDINKSFFLTLIQRVFTNYVDKTLKFFDHLPPCIDIFYGMNIDKK